MWVKTGLLCLWGVFCRIVSSGVALSVLASLVLSLTVALSVDILEGWSVGHDGMLALLLCGMLLSLLFASVLSYWMVRVWLQYRKAELGFKLQLRVVLASTIMGMAPTILISGLTFLFFDHGVKAWFHSSVRPAFSRCASDSYKCFSNVLSENATHLARYLSNQSFLREHVAIGAELFGFEKARLVTKDELVEGEDPGNKLSMLQKNIPSAGEVSIFTDEGIMYVVAPLDPALTTYVMASRSLPEDGWDGTMHRDVHDYRRDLAAQMSVLQARFSIAFLLLFLILLFISMWFGVGFAETIVNPLSHLFWATKRVQDGDFNFKIEKDCRNSVGEEIETVISAFNHMVERLGAQRLQLECVYREIDSRREFMETVLSGISSGVIALSSSQCITLINDKAKELLSSEDALNKPVTEVFPEVLKLGEGCVGDLIIFRNKKALTLSIYMKRLGSRGSIITFDDISGLVEAQRKAAWSDVARRIAHEIKNPITPVYLAAERLNSKYAEQIVSGKETFLRYTDTIMKHISEISNIVDEFAQFARMPNPVFEIHNICDLLREVSFSGQFGKKFVNYELNLPEEDILLSLDKEQISRVFVNIFKNACESISTIQNEGRIIVTVYRDKSSKVVVEVQDNGAGFPEDLIGVLTEPYVTTRDQGTGLGLAIVKKILDEHKAKISFHNADCGGGVVTVTFSEGC